MEETETIQFSVEKEGCIFEIQRFEKGIKTATIKRTWQFGTFTFDKTTGLEALKMLAEKGSISLLEFEGETEDVSELINIETSITVNGKTITDTPETRKLQNDFQNFGLENNEWLETHWEMLLVGDVTIEDN